MLNMNNKPNMMTRTPIITFSAENSVSIDAIPKNNKLTPKAFQKLLRFQINLYIFISNIINYEYY